MACSQITLHSEIDGFATPALAAHSKAPAVGGVVVIQEIFGLTDHVAAMCATFAAVGYEVLAPGLFERIEGGFHAPVDAAGIEKGRAAVSATPWPQAMSDVQAAIDALPQPTYVTGFCYGGAIAWLAAARCRGLKACASFYGRLIADMLDEIPAVPVMLHYGAHDISIPPANVESVRQATPDSPLYLYDAGHGFCRAGSQDFDIAARDLAVTRTLDWFARWR
jgi:carboxymethylenebutenolidase